MFVVRQDGPECSDSAIVASLVNSLPMIAHPASTASTNTALTVTSVSVAQLEKSSIQNAQGAPHALMAISPPMGYDVLRARQDMRSNRHPDVYVPTRQPAVLSQIFAQMRPIRTRPVAAAASSAAEDISVQVVVPARFARLAERQMPAELLASTVRLGK